MARSSNSNKSKAKKNTVNNKEKIKNNKLLWFIMSILCALIIFFTITKTGKLGIFLNNCLIYLLGSLYIFPLLSLFSYAIYAIFLSEKYPKSAKVIAGIFVLNSAIIILSALIDSKINSFSKLSSFIADSFKLINKDSELSFSGGIIGNFFYVILFVLLNKSGAIIFLAVLFIISLILIIPTNYYKKAYENVKNNNEQRKEEKKRLRQEQIKLQLQQEEIRRAQQAERMAKEAEEEIAKEEKKEEISIPQENIVVEEIEDKRDSVLSNSPTFINLSKEEIYGNSAKKTSNNKQDNSPKIISTVKKYSGSYRLPKPIDDFLEAIQSDSSNINKTSAKLKGEKVIEILKTFDIKATLLNTYIGPSVTKFEVKPDSSVKINKIMAISDNIKMELAAKDIRIEAPIPGRSAVGIEIPNVEPIPVRMYDLLKNIPNEKKNIELLFTIGKDLMGKPIYCDLSKMPHLLIAGATGSGKSVCINSIIVSFLMRTNPDNVKLVLVDPKKVEFTPYKDIPHLLWPIIDEGQMAANMLKRIVVMMEERYDKFADVNVRNISAYNSYVDDHNKNLKPDETVIDKMPYIVVIIDELADLMTIAKKDVEVHIQRITQLARASGIHLIVATQRPSTDVITGLIKSNIPSRISFAVASSIDSRTILDQTGAERLLGNGDMLYYPQGENAPIRLQGVYVTDKEIKKITDYVKSQATPQYEDSYYQFKTLATGTTVMSGNSNDNDPLYDEVVEYVKASQKASTSLLQRRFGIGYGRAARLIDTLEDRGLIGPANGSKPREVYIKDDSQEE